MRQALRTGIALFNAGWYHAAHDAWEDRWLGLESGTPDERFLHGLIQYTAAVYHLGEGNREGAVGLAESASEYLHGLANAYRDVDLDGIRDGLRAIQRVEASTPADTPPIAYAGATITLEDLRGVEIQQAAEIIAHEDAAFDPDTVEAAIEYARGEGPGGRFGRLLSDLATDEAHRGVIYDRLEQHVSRERRRRADVQDLFDVDD